MTDRRAGRVTAENRAHLIDNDLESQAELDALITDYVAEAQRPDDPRRRDPVRHRAR